MEPAQMWRSMKQAQQAGGQQAAVQLTHEMLRHHGLAAVMDTLVYGLREFSSQWDAAMEAADRAKLNQDAPSRAQADQLIERVRRQ